jgi:putative Mg2+ transporter-C (MgtC) family protein
MHFDLASLSDSALRLALALLLGCVIGFERQWHQKMAGLRTNALVALGAAGPAWSAREIRLASPPRW